jgi:RNA polymerase sigma factor (sigma-70 family)
MTHAVANLDLLVADHQAGVFRYLCRFLGHRDAARDLTQEVFLRVSRAEVPDTTADGQRAWVFRIARNLAINHVRDRRRHGQVMELIEVHRPATQELTLALDQAIASLGEMDREVFLLRESGGLTYAEVASACEISEDAVRARLRRARAELREMLGHSLAAQRDRGVRFQ